MRNLCALKLLNLANLKMRNANSLRYLIDSGTQNDLSV
jgi:hypothetical protein